MALIPSLRRNPVPVRLRGEYWGAQSLIARVLGVSKQAVNNVWRGAIISARIRAEIEKFLADPDAYRRKHGRRKRAARRAA